MHVGKASHEPESQVTSNRSNDVAALPAIIQGYLSRGYRFVDMSGRSGLNARTTSVSLSSGSVNVPVNQASTAVTATVKDVRGVVAGWTTSKTGGVATDNAVRTYDGTGTLLKTYTRTAWVNYQSATFSDARDPADPVSPAGKTKVRISLGIHGDGKSDCSVTLVEPSL